MTDWSNKKKVEVVFLYSRRMKELSVDRRQ
jgi:hypothetical protein